MKKYLFAFLFLFVALSSWATQYGPYFMYNNNPTPNGYTKVVCFSNPNYIGVGVVLVNVETNEQIHLSTSSTYQPMWFYFVPGGTYRVVAVNAHMAKVKINGFDVEEGDEIVFCKNASGSLIAFPDK